MFSHPISLVLSAQPSLSWGAGRQRQSIEEHISIFEFLYMCLVCRIVLTRTGHSLQQFSWFQSRMLSMPKSGLSRSAKLKITQDPRWLPVLCWPPLLPAIHCEVWFFGCKNVLRFWDPVCSSMTKMTINLINPSQSPSCEQSLVTGPWHEAICIRSPRPRHAQHFGGLQNGWFWSVLDGVGFGVLPSLLWAIWTCNILEPCSHFRPGCSAGGRLHALLWTNLGSGLRQADKLPKVVRDKLPWTKDLNSSAANKGITTQFPLSVPALPNPEGNQNLSKSELSHQRNGWTSHRRRRTLGKNNSRTMMLCYVYGTRTCKPFFRCTAILEQIKTDKYLAWWPAWWLQIYAFTHWAVSSCGFKLMLCRSDTTRETAIHCHPE